MCEFCEQYKFAKEEAKEFKKEFGVNTYFKVMLFEYRMKNRKHRGSMTYRGVKLKYCPSCGKKL